MRRFHVIATIVLAAAATLAPRPAEAQLPSLAGCRQSGAQGGVLAERKGERHLLTGTPERTWQIDCDDMQFFADSIEVLPAESLIRATGHVLFVSGGNRISAERMEFNTSDRTGTFYQASGTLSLGERADRSLFGTQEPEAMFYGEEVHKIGPRKYRLVRGGFTTCVQPTPRWEMVTGSATISVDNYALLRNTVFRVKGVPLMYLPVFYYPIQEDDRSTGFLIPVYGNADVRGHSIMNAFFWAISRSQDATLHHDWYSRTGHGLGGEYRYIQGPGSHGNSAVYVLNERQTTTLHPDGSTSTTPGKRSHRIQGDMAQRLPAGMYLRASSNYFSSITTEQRFQQDIDRATDRRRSVGGNLTGNWGAWSLGASLDRHDTFFGEDTFVTSGSLPRVSLNRGERPIAGLPVYFGVGSEFVSIQRRTTYDGIVDDEEDLEPTRVVEDLGLTRVDITPSVRVPFNRWQFLTFNTVAAWRGTWWSESLDEDGQRVDEPIGRRYLDFQARITGPVFHRIFDTPKLAYAQRFKHVIEPSLTIRRVTDIGNRDRIVQMETGDFVVGNVTSLQYGLANRLYARRDVAREILTATVSQTYYTDQDAVNVDRDFQSSFNGAGPAPTNFTPVVFNLRASPTDRFFASFRAEWDHQVKAIRTMTASGTVHAGGRLFATAGWTQQRHVPDLPGFEEERSSNHLRGSTTVRSAMNRVGGTYDFNIDLKEATVLNQRVLAYYNAQCCGIAAEYQVRNLRGVLGFGPPQDRRFNISFSLAGIGTFSNLLGALSGGQQAR
jgi:LPS-assembly protein